MTVPAFQATDRAPRARPPLPRLRVVLMEHVRVTGRALRAPALGVAALLALITFWVALRGVRGDVDVSLNAWPTQLPGLMGALLPIAVWARDERFGPGFLWTLPVDRRRHALTKVLAGWAWLMAGVALFVLWILGLSLATGSRVLPETLQLVPFDVAAAGPVDPSALRAVRWVPGPQVWAVPFTAATACYLLASALALGTRHPLRWVIGTLVAFMFGTFASVEASKQLGVGWIDRAPERLLDLLVGSRYGLDAVLTARLETLGTSTALTSGEHARVWWGVPDLADWRTATLLWTGAGLLALWAAASRHRERRRS